MKFESIHTFIAFKAFAISGAIACALIVGILVFNRNSAGYSRQLRWIVSAIAAIGFAPSFIKLIELPLIIWPASFWFLSAFSGEARLVELLEYGLVPCLITCVLIYEVWNRSANAGLNRMDASFFRGRAILLSLFWLIEITVIAIAAGVGKEFDDFHSPHAVEYLVIALGSFFALPIISLCVYPIRKKFTAIGFVTFALVVAFSRS